MSTDIQESDAGYRKGLVLGLTLAEVGILIIFVLLLLIGFDQIQLSQFSDKVPIPTAEWKAIQSERDQLRQILEASGLTDESVPEDFTRLILSLREVSESEDIQGTLDEIRSESARLREIKDRLAKVLTSISDGEESADALASQAQQIVDLEGQKIQLFRQLDRSGNGLVYPSCWNTAEGRIQYVYSIDLTDDGIRMEEKRHQERESDRIRLGFPTSSSGRYWGTAEFLIATKSAFDWSVANECRFFVIVHDSTGPSQKERYKTLLTTVENHFYKLLSREPPTF